MSVKLTYIGAHDGVDVDLGDGRIATVMNGETEEFPEEIAASLLEQEAQWRRAESARKTAKKEG